MKYSNIHYCSYCEKRIPVELRDDIEYTGGYKITGRFGKHCKRCYKELNEQQI